jgi:hypothetical protein
MTVYLGYYRTVPWFAEEAQARARDEAGPDARFRRLVLELPEKLPAGCLLLGSYAPLGGGGAVLADPGPPSVLIVETEDARDLGFITQYYAGYLLFHWVPAIRVGATRDEREAWASEDSFTPPRGAT